METSVDSVKIATQAHDSGDWVQAAKLYATILAAEPDNVNVLHRFGRLCRQTGRYDEAHQYLDRAVELSQQPMEKATHRVDYAELLLAEGRLPEALAMCEQARDDLDDVAPPVALLLLQSDAFRRLGQLRDSRDVLAEALEHHSDDESLRLRLAQAHQELGDVESAAAQFEHVLDLNSQHPEAVLQLTRLMLDGDVPIGIPWVERMRMIVPFTDDDDLRVQIRFAMAAVHERRDEGELAFAAYRQANTDLTQLNAHRGAARTVDELSARVDRLIRFFSEGRVEQLRAQVGSRSTQPMFLLGMPGAGQSEWLRVHAGRPDRMVWDGAPSLSDLAQSLTRGLGEFPEQLGEVAPQDWLAVRNQYLDALQQAGPFANFVVNPSPATAIYFGLVAILFPKARVLRFERERASVIQDCFESYYPCEEIPSNDPQTLGKVFDQMERLMAHWRLLMPMETEFARR